VSHAGGLIVPVNNGVSAQGDPTWAHVAYRYDGKDYPYAASTSPGTSLCLGPERGRPRRPMARVTLTRERQASEDRSDASYRPGVAFRSAVKKAGG